MGKWHVSDFSAGGTYPGANGPTDYGFTISPNLNFPFDKSTASPAGAANEGAEGWNLKNPPYPIYSPSGTSLGLTNPGKLADDAYIADQFLNALPNLPTTTPWFACVSFVNPHDITHFPYNYGLTPAFGGTGPFADPSGPISIYSYNSPPILGAGSLTGTEPQLEIYLPALQSPYTTVPTAAPWNFLDNPADPALAYGAGAGKPDLQAFFQSDTNNQSGAVLGYVNQTTANTAGWVTFLNYYTWMQGCVDAEIGRTITALQTSASWLNTVIIFTSDHGDYGGSHWLHMKGGALYDEVINVPLYVSFPAGRVAGTQTSPGTWGPQWNPASSVKPFVCSSVDIFPLLYELARGSNTSSWRVSTNPYSYLAGWSVPATGSPTQVTLGRESILDGLYAQHPKQRRLSGFVYKNGFINFQSDMPYVLHTQDEYPNFKYGVNGLLVPGHAIAYRTVDLSVNATFNGAPVYGGAKLGSYSLWHTCETYPGTTPPGPGNPFPSGTQFEFYDYTDTQNYGETGNEYAANALAPDYVADFLANAPNELYYLYPQLQSAYQDAFTAYTKFTQQTGCPTP